MPSIAVVAPGTASRLAPVPFHLCLEAAALAADAGVDIRIAVSPDPTSVLAPAGVDQLVAEEALEHGGHVTFFESGHRGSACGSAFASGGSHSRRARRSRSALLPAVDIQSARTRLATIALNCREATATIVALSMLEFDLVARRDVPDVHAERLGGVGPAEIAALRERLEAVLSGDAPSHRHASA
jgi:hypothetical protein